MPFSAESLRRISGWLDAVVQFLDSLFGVAGRVGILFTFGIIVYAVVQLFFSADDPAQTPTGKVLVLLNDNWKAALLVMAPVFYLPLRIFINRIREITVAGTAIRTNQGGTSEPGREEYRSRD